MPILGSRPRPMLSPFPFGTAMPSKPEHEAKALAETKDTLVTLRNLMRECDIPSEHFPTVYQMFQMHLNGICNAEDYKHQEERSRKEGALRKQRLAKRLNVPVGTTFPPHFTDYGPVGSPMVGSVDDDIFDMTDEDLDAELARK